MNVYIAPQRNHQKARSSSFGFTFGFSSLSRSAWNGTFTRLKKYRCPSHTMPNMMWAKRMRTLIRDGMSSNMGALYTQSTRRSTGRVRRRGLPDSGDAAGGMTGAARGGARGGPRRPRRASSACTDPT